jgi:hypothetical protein
VDFFGSLQRIRECGETVCLIFRKYNRAKQRLCFRAARSWQSRSKFNFFSIKNTHMRMHSLMTSSFNSNRNFSSSNLSIKEILEIIQGVFEMRALILTTSYWLHVELGKNI